MNRDARVVHHPGERELDPAVALQDVVAELAEEHVVALAARQVVVAEAARAVVAEVGVEVVEVMGRVAVREVDGVLGPPRIRVEARAVRIAVVLPGAVDEQLAARVRVRGGVAGAGRGTVGAAVELGAAQSLEAAARAVAGRGDVGLEGLDDAARQEDLVAVDEVVLLVAVEHVVAGTADDHVAAEVAEDDVVVAVLERVGDDLAHRSEQGRLDLLQPRVGQVRVGDLLDHRAVVGEDDVVVRALRPAEERPGAFAEDQVAAGVHVVGDR